MAKQIKIPELTTAISEVIKKLYKSKESNAFLNANNDYYAEIGKSLGLERYTSTDHNVTCSELFAICDFFRNIPFRFSELVEKENSILKYCA